MVTWGTGDRWHPRGARIVTKSVPLGEPSILVPQLPRAEVSQTRLAGNRVVGGQGGAVGPDGEGVGGGVWIDSAYVCARRTRIAGNVAFTSHDDIFGNIDWC